MRAHTPGPWKSGKFSAFEGIPIISQPDALHNSVVIARARCVGSREETEANARLISAAPEMLALLKEYVGDSTDSHQVEFHDRVIALLDRAKGAAP